jgi:integrase|tara:strand:- start:88 stop:513 length:426 start_codon:yes stop_codon:yes gene_type:complete
MVTDERIKLPDCLQAIVIEEQAATGPLALRPIASGAGPVSRYEGGRAGVDKETDRGVLNFHAVRKTFVTFLLHDPALAPKEVQELSRHADLDLTMNVYGESRQDELRDAVSRLCNLTLPRSEHVHSTHDDAASQNAKAQPP